MLKKSQKQFFLVILIILFLIAAFFIFFHAKSQNVPIKEKSISTKFYNSKEITLTSNLPISDELGKKLDGKGTEDGIQGYQEFNIKNNLKESVKYQIYITKKELKNEVRGNYIKFYLTDEADNPLEGYNQNSVPTYTDLLALNELPGSRLLYSGELKNNETKKLILRAWLSDSYIVSTENREFTFEINIKTN